VTFVNLFVDERCPTKRLEHIEMPSWITINVVVKNHIHDMAMLGDVLTEMLPRLALATPTNQRLDKVFGCPKDILPI